MDKREHGPLATASSFLGEPDGAFLVIETTIYKHGAPMALLSKLTTTLSEARNPNCQRLTFLG
jgi:hypothetical protein